MITIVYSTHKDQDYNNKFKQHLLQTVGLKNVQVLEYQNNNEFSLTEIYNKGLEDSLNDIVVFCHNDIIFETKNWGNKLIKHFKRNPEYGILGVAGSTSLPKSAMWWEDKSRMRGIVNHKHEDKQWESKYSNNLGNKLDPVVLVDGLFIVTHKNRIKENFNEEIKGFHMYDVSFCFENFNEGVNIGVLYDIRLTHLSIGQTNQQWEDNRKEFAKLNKNKLPIKIKRDLNLNSPLKILMTGLYFKELTGSEMYMFELAKGLVKLNCDITIVSDINGPLSKIANKMGIKTLPTSQMPGYKIGDGKWGFNTPNGFKVSQPNAQYKIGEVDFDIIHTQHKIPTQNVVNLYPNIPKISTIHSEIIPAEDPVFDDTILKYIAIRPEIKDKLINKDGVIEDSIELIYNPINENKFNTNNIKDDNYILFVGTIDYLRRNSLYDIAEYSKSVNKELWIVGRNLSNYLDDLLSLGNVKYFEPTTEVEKFVKNCSETAGILLGRTTIEGWMCGKPGWIYNVLDNGLIIDKNLHNPPTDIDKFKSSYVSQKIKEEYIKIIEKW